MVCFPLGQDPKLGMVLHKFRSKINNTLFVSYKSMVTWVQNINMLSIDKYRKYVFYEILVVHLNLI